jgi:hypothetical protein
MILRLGAEANGPALQGNDPVRVAGGAVRTTALLLLAVASACGAPAERGGSDAGPGPDAGVDAGSTDGSSAGSDAGIDAPPGAPNPFPSDPRGGEFAWVVSMDGAREEAAVAVDVTGNILVAARQGDAVTLGDVHVPPPPFEAMLVVKLTPDGAPLWMRSVTGGAKFVDPRAIAVTSAGNVVVGANVQGDPNAPSPDPTLGADDGFVALLDSATGATLWSQKVASSWDDTVAGIVVGRDPDGVDAIYVYGQLANNATIAGHAVTAGAYVIRFDEDGTLRWVESFASLNPGFNASIALDPARGPVIAGRIEAVHVIFGDQVVEGTAAVAGLDPDGHVRFARGMLSQFTAFARELDVAPSGDIYLASETRGAHEIVVDDHLIAPSDGISHPLLIRFTPDGHYRSSTLVGGPRDAFPTHVATEPDGAADMVIGCDDRVDVQPEIACADFDGGSVVVSYGADDEYRWATYVGPAFVDTVAPAPGNRLIIAGEALRTDVNFGGVHLPTRRLFIAALAGGPARLPSPLPAAPVIASVAIDGISDLEIRQGGSGTLVIHGTGLDQVTSARLGDIDVHVPAGAGTANELRLPVSIPHGHAPGALSLRLANAGGSAQQTGVVIATPIVAGPGAPSTGRGTFASPVSICGAGASFAVRYGDLLRVLDGVHTCGTGVPRGATVRGDSRDGAIVQGSFFADDEGFGTTSIESLTIESPDFAAIDMFFGGKLAVRDVVIQASSGSGVLVDSGGTATLERYRYLDSSGTAILIGSGQVQAHDVTADRVFKGVIMVDGTLELADSSLSTDESTIDAGDDNTNGGTRNVTITNTTLRSTRVAVIEAGAHLSMLDCTLERGSGRPGRSSEGMRLLGGTISVRHSALRGFDFAGVATEPGPAFPPGAHAVNATFDDVEIRAADTGISHWSPDDQSLLRLRNTHVVGGHDGIVLVDGGGGGGVDLGTTASPGNNQVENTSGGPAFDDQQNGGVVDAHGTTLNGMTFDGVVQGPASVPGAYQLRGTATIRF